MPTELVAPIDVQIELTERCNMMCVHCYNYWRPNGVGAPTSHQLTLAQIRYVVDMLSQHQIPSITVTGGEPFVCRNEAFMLLDLAAKAEISATINSNFSLMREADLQRLAQYSPKVPVLVSLLSADEQVFKHITGLESAVHSRIIRTIGRAVELGIPVSINMVLLPQNVTTMRATAELVKRLGVRTFCATKALPNANHPNQDVILSREVIRNSVDHLLEIGRELQIPVEILGCYPKCLLYGSDGFVKFFHRTCYAGVTTMTIGADGAARPCSHVGQSYGNVFHEPFPTIWNHLSGWRDESYVPEECSGCVFLKSCRGGCRVNNLQGCLTAVDMHAVTEQKHTLMIDSKFRTLDTDTQVSTGDFIVNPHIRFRPESFGSMISIIDRPSIVLINESTTSFLKQAKLQRTAISEIGFLGESGAVSESERRGVRSLFRKLVHREVLISVPPVQER